MRSLTEKLRKLSEQSKAFGYMRATFIIRICANPMSDAN